MMAPMVATLEGVRAVNVAPLNCAGPNACDIVSVYTSVFWIAMVVLVIVGGLLVYAALRFRRTDDREPAQVHGNPRLEILWTAVPLVIVSFLFVRTTLRMDYVRNGPPPQQTIQVTGIQWAWSFKYPNGKTSITRLTIPVGQVVRLQVTSKDVLHSFWVPRLGGQIYAKPGYQNSGWIEASQPGQYLGQCNELCGINHFSMLLEVDAVSDADYQAFLSGAAPPGAAAEKVTGVPAAVNVGETDALKFEPTTATAKIGDVIEWKNNGSLVHNVVFDNNQLPSSDPMNQGDTFEVKFTKAGTYTYVCKFHEANNMRGTITVTGG
jgi:cytochrome c oxidase subunit II